MASLYIESITLTPNPAFVSDDIMIAVEIYTLFPSENLYPSEDLYPGAELFGLFPHETTNPGNDVYQTAGGIIE